MNSSDHTMRTLVLIPIAAAMVGILLMLGITLLPGHSPAPVPSPEMHVNADHEMARSGDATVSFHVAHPDGDIHTFAL